MVPEGIRWTAEAGTGQLIVQIRQLFEMTGKRWCSSERASSAERYAERWSILPLDLGAYREREAASVSAEKVIVGFLLRRLMKQPAPGRRSSQALDDQGRRSVPERNCGAGRLPRSLTMSTC